MSRYSNDNGCFTIITIVGFLLFSIIKAFEGQFIPVIIVISIALILWFENIYVKHKSERKKLAETPEGRKEIDTNNSKLFIVIIIIVIGVIISIIFQSKKREYFENNTYTLDNEVKKSNEEMVTEPIEEVVISEVQENYDDTSSLPYPKTNYDTTERTKLFDVKLEKREPKPEKPGFEYW